MTADLRSQLQETLGAAYVLERELGGGGMSRVFLAEETRLGRKVVVKVLSPELAAGVSTERFQREIRVAASLQQANIVPLLFAGETEGLPFYTMPFVEGLSLRARLERSGPLSVADAVSLLRDVARALAYAHDHGVVHRDIKPENVLLSGDAAVVTDFGIAKALSASRTATTATTLTRDGTGIGTPAYMAPEQAMGDPGVDHRADIYAFGCMAYELVTGQTPFPDRPLHRIVAAHLSETPRPVTGLRSDTPAPLAELIRRCLEKDPDRRPQSARELLPALEAIATATYDGAAPRRRFVGLAGSAALGAGAMIVIAAILRLTRPSGEDSGAGASLAVLPFVAVEDTALEYRAEGLTDEIQAAIRKMSGITLVSRAGVNRFHRRRDVDAREAGRVLGARFVMQGTFRAVGARVKVSARLSRTSDNADLWQDTFEPQAQDAFAAEDEIRNRITEALRLHFPGGPGAGAVAAAGRGTRDSAAYDLYERGQFLLKRRGPGVRLAVQHFEKAIGRDSTYARAYAALSAALELLPNFVDTSFAAVSERATTAARRALALDPTLAEAHTSLALAAMHGFRWAEADSEFRRALAADVGNPSAHQHYARYLVYTGRLAESVAQLHRAKALDPTSAVISAWLAHNLLLAGRRREAFAESDRALELDSMNVPVVHFAARVNLAAGNFAKARVLLGREPPIPPWMGASAMLYGLMGDRQTVLRLRQEIERGSWRSFRESGLAMAALGVGDTARALDALERATDAHEFWPSAPILIDPVVLDQLRGSTRFAALLRRIGLDAGAFASPSKQ